MFNCEKILWILGWNDSMQVSLIFVPIFVVLITPLPSPLHFLSQIGFPFVLCLFHLWAKYWYALWWAGEKGCTMAWITAADKKWCESNSVWLEQPKLSERICPNSDATEDDDDHHPDWRATRQLQKDFWNNELPWKEAWKTYWKYKTIMRDLGVRRG